MAVLAISLVISIGVASYYFDFEFYSLESFAFLGIFLLLSILLSLYLSYRFSSPMGFVIQKTLQIAQASHGTDSKGLLNLEEVFKPEEGEYSELERSLEIIRKKLKERRVALAIQQEGHQTLTDSIDEALVTVNLKSEIQSSNLVFKKVFAFNSTQTVEGLLLEEVVREPQLKKAFDEALNQGLKNSLNILLPTKLGEKYFRLKVSPLVNQKNKKIYGALGILYDIHDLKLAAKVRTDFIENASHELKTPLTAMKGSVSILLEEAEKINDPLITQLSGSLKKSVDRMIHLVTDLLTLSSIESQSSLEFSEIAVSEISQDALKSVEFWREQSGHHITIESSVTSLYGNYSSVFQLLQNLLLNAMKYSDQNKLIKVVWEQTESETRLRVIDQGHGIGKEHLPRLFERFYRVDKGRNREMGGSGLGLALVKHIVQLHKGTVTVTSELGVGSEFVCAFPKKSV